MKLTTQGFHHITFVAADAARTVAFYRDLLGLALVKDLESASRTDTAPLLWFGNESGEPGTLVSVVEDRTAPRGRAGAGGVHPLALGTTTYEAQLRWKRRRMDHGVQVSGPLNRGYFSSIYFRDPDGQVLEIATAGPGYQFDEPLDALGQKVLMHDPARLAGGRDEAAIARLTHADSVPVITPEMTLQGIHHISGMTDDIERASDFYQSALGITLIQKNIHQDDPGTAHLVRAHSGCKPLLDHSSWTLFGWTPRHPKARAGTGQTRHVAFRAQNANLQLAWHDHLSTLGVAVSPIVDRTHYSSFSFTAPDGQPLEIATDIRRHTLQGSN